MRWITSWRYESVRAQEGRWTAVAAATALLALAPTAPSQGPPLGELPWWDRSDEAQVGHYSIKTDVPADQANALARHLNLMYAEYSRRLAQLPPRAREHLNVYIFEQQKDYVDTLRTRFGVNATGSGGMFFISAAGSGLAFFIGTDKGPLPPSRVDHVLQHEGFHQFAFSRFGRDLPIWVNEGLAEFFGESVVINGTLILGQANPRVIDTIKKAIEAGTFVPFEQMLPMTSATWVGNVRAGKARLQYNQAWSMVHFLVYADPNGDGRPDYQAAFERYLRLINDGVSSAQAFFAAFQTDEYEAFEKRWKTYALAARPTAFVTALERIEFLIAGALELNTRGLRPTTLESLRDALREIKFTWSIPKHDVTLELDAADDSLFTIPKDDLTSKQPVFQVAPVSVNGLSLRQKKLEAAHPSPALISTRDLKPRGLSVAWQRDKAGAITGYEIVVK